MQRGSPAASVSTAFSRIRIEASLHLGAHPANVGGSFGPSLNLVSVRLARGIPAIRFAVLFERTEEIGFSCERSTVTALILTEGSIDFLTKMTKDKVAAVSGVLALNGKIAFEI